MKGRHEREVALPGLDVGPCLPRLEIEGLFNVLHVGLHRGLERRRAAEAPARDADPLVLAPGVVFVDGLDPIGLLAGLEVVALGPNLVVERRDVEEVLVAGLEHGDRRRHALRWPIEVPAAESVGGERIVVARGIGVGRLGRCGAAESDIPARHVADDRGHRLDGPVHLDDDVPLDRRARLLKGCHQLASSLFLTTRPDESVGSELQGVAVPLRDHFRAVERVGVLLGKDEKAEAVVAEDDPGLREIEAELLVRTAARWDEDVARRGEFDDVAGGVESSDWERGGGPGRRLRGGRR